MRAPSVVLACASSFCLVFFPRAGVTSAADVDAVIANCTAGREIPAWIEPCETLATIGTR